MGDGVSSSFYCSPKLNEHFFFSLSKRKQNWSRTVSLAALLVLVSVLISTSDRKKKKERSKVVLIDGFECWALCWCVLGVFTYPHRPPAFKLDQHIKKAKTYFCWANFASMNNLQMLVSVMGIIRFQFKWINSQYKPLHCDATCEWAVVWPASFGHGGPHYCRPTLVSAFWGSLSWTVNVSFHNTDLWHNIHMTVNHLMDSHHHHFVFNIYWGWRFSLPRAEIYLRAALAWANFRSTFRKPPAVTLTAVAKLVVA